MEPNAPQCPICRIRRLASELDLMTHSCSSCRRAGRILGACRVCGEERVLGHDDVCDQCIGAAAAGPLDQLPPAAKPFVGCSRCGHRAFVRALLRERAFVGPERDAESAIRPMAVTFGPHLQAFGTFEARICRGCGFTDFYVQNPERIPIGPMYGTELLEVEEPPLR